MSNYWVKLNDVVKYLEESGDLKTGVGVKKLDKAVKSPSRTHGSCCYCDECGYLHDDCVCSHNYTVDWINSLEKFDGDI